MCQRTDGLTPHYAGVIDNFLKLSHRRTTLSGSQVCLTTQVNGIKKKVQSLNIAPKFVYGCRRKDFQSFAMSVASKPDCGMNGRQIVGLNNRVLREPSSQVVGQLRSLEGIACDGQRNRREEIGRAHV